MRLDGIPKLEDLREMSEGQFVEAFEMLRERTRDWSEFPPELLIEDSRRILILRCSLGITQRGLSEKFGVCRDAIKTLESGRRHIIHLGPAKRWTPRIERILASQKPDLSIALAKFKEFKRFRHDEKPILTDKPITKLSESELRDTFDVAEKETLRFTKFSPDFLMSLPQSLTIFRLAKGLSHDKFAKLLGVDQRTVRSISSGKSSIGFRRSCRLSHKLKDLFAESDEITFDRVLRSFRAFSKFLHLDFGIDIAKGLSLARIQPLTPFERVISEILLESSIKFEAHAEVDCIRKVLSMDFALPEHADPKVVIEAFSSSRKSIGPSLLRIREIDHRFRMLKLAKPRVKTILCIDFKRPIVLDLAHKFIELELFDSDFLLICDEVKKLPELIVKMSHPSS